MKARLMTAVVGLSLFAAILCFFQTPVINVAVSIISVVAVYEIAQAVGCDRPRSLLLLCACFAAVVPFLKTSLISNILPVLVYLLFVLVFLVVIRHYPDLDITRVGLLMMMSLGVSMALNCLVYIRDTAPSMSIGIYYVLIIFGSAWWSDAGAYFVGSRFGKHKMAPLISPKKSMEGLYGGLVVAVLGNLLVSCLFSLLHNSQILGGYSPVDFHINYLYVALVSPVLALTGVLGDLSASVIKRRFEVKDFGTIFPGHGGMMDRFDSLLFVAPLVYLLMRFWPFVVVA